MKLRITWILTVLITGALFAAWSLGFGDVMHGWIAVAFFGIGVAGSGALIPTRYS